MASLDIGIIGAGLMGMSLARQLARDGHRVTVLERSEQIGGLATWQDFGGFQWDRFYHVILPTDLELIAFLRNLGLEQELEWQRTYTGFYVDQQLHSISSNIEFLKFPLLSLRAEAGLAWKLIYCSRISNWRELERVSVADWLLRVSGQEAYEKLWKPLLLAKLGPGYTRVSAVFIWSYIKRMFSARDGSASAESLGHVRGGYQQIFARLQADVEQAGGNVQTKQIVEAVNATSADAISITVNGQHKPFDRVICTSPASVLRKIVDSELLTISQPDKPVEYLGVVCAVLVTKKALTPYYVVNIADAQIPFTGLIGMSNVVPSVNTAGYHLTYLPKYMLSTDSEFERSDDYFKESFLNGVKRMLPEFDQQSLVSLHIHRALKVQPLQVLNYSNRVVNVQTKHPNLFVLNTAQFVGTTLNNNEVIAAVNRFYDKYQFAFNTKCSA